MQWSDIPRDPTPRTLRQFAGLWLAFFGAWACWEWLARGRPAVAVALGVAALAVGLTGLARPSAVRPVFVGWMVLAFPVGWLVSRLLLAALYYTVFTPIGLLFRLLGRDALELRRRPDRPTYWSPRPEAVDPLRYLREY
jgi:hypothetical protein